MAGSATAAASISGSATTAPAAAGVYRFTRNGKATEIGMGAADAVTLAEAREERKAAAYDRATKVERRRPVMRAWADHCDGADADNVVAF